MLRSSRGIYCPSCRGPKCPGNRQGGLPSPSLMPKIPAPTRPDFHATCGGHRILRTQILGLQFHWNVHVPPQAWPGVTCHPFAPHQGSSHTHTTTVAWEQVTRKNTDPALSTQPHSVPPGATGWGKGPRGWRDREPLGRREDQARSSRGRRLGGTRRPLRWEMGARQDAPAPRLLSLHSGAKATTQPLFS